MCHADTEVFRKLTLLQDLHSAGQYSVTSQFSNGIDLEEAPAGRISRQLGSPHGPYCSRKFTRRNRVQRCTTTEHYLSYSQLLRNQDRKYGTLS